MFHFSLKGEQRGFNVALIYYDQKAGNFVKAGMPQKSSVADLMMIFRILEARKGDTRFCDAPDYYEYQMPKNRHLLFIM